MEVKLPNGQIIRNVPEGTSKDEIMRKAVSAGLATAEDFHPKQTNINEEADKAVKAVDDDMPWYQRTLIGAGRGLTDIGQAGRQVFEDYIDQPITNMLGEGMTDKTADGYRRSVQAELDTYDTGMGDSTAASIGRFIGQTAPAIAIPGAASGLAARTVGGALGGGMAGGAAEVGGSGEDVLEGAGIGAVLGGTVGAVAKPLGSLAESSALTDDMVSNVRRAVNKIKRDKLDVDDLDLSDEAKAMVQKYMDDPKSVRQMVSGKVDPDDLDTIDEIGEMVGRSSDDLLDINFFNRLKEGYGEVAESRGSLLESLKNLNLRNVPNRDLGFGLAGTVLGDPTLGLMAVGASRAMPHVGYTASALKGTLGARLQSEIDPLFTARTASTLAGSLSDMFTEQDPMPEDYIGRLMEAMPNTPQSQELQQAAQEGPEAYKSKVFELQDSDPEFRGRLLVDDEL